MMAAPSSQIYPGWSHGPNGWTYTPQTNPAGTLGVPQQYGPGQAPGVQPNSSNPGSDLLDFFSGHAAYAPGGQFGGNATTNTYAQGASQLGAGIAGTDASMGNTAVDNYGSIGATQYTNLTGLGNTANNTFQGLGNRYANQAAPTVDMSGANLAAANQNNALGMYANAAAGNGPSAAQAQLQAGVDASIKAQAAEAASAKGGFGVANAQHDAAINSGMIAGNAANSAAQLRAQEQQAGMAGYAGLSSTAEAQQAANAQYLATLKQNQNFQNANNVLNAYGMGNTANLGYNTLGANTAFNYQNLGANQNLGYNTLGQGTQLSYNQLGQGAESAQLNADIENQKAANAQMSGNAQRAQQTGGGILGMLGSLF